MSCDGSMIGRPLAGERMLFGGHHQNPRLKLSFEAQRHVHSHLVAVEVGVEGGADQAGEAGSPYPRSAWARTPGCRDGWSVGARFQEHRVLADHLFEDVPTPAAARAPPYAWICLTVPDRPLGVETGVDEGLETVRAPSSWAGRTRAASAPAPPRSPSGRSNPPACRGGFWRKRPCFCPSACRRGTSRGACWRRLMTRPRRPFVRNRASTDFLQHPLLVADDDVRRRAARFRRFRRLLRLMTRR